MTHAGRLAAAAALWAAACSGATADVRVQVSGVRSGDGRVLVALCGPSTFLGRSCEATGSAAARAGTTEIVIPDVPPGVYAVQAVHDENGNLDLDRNAFGLPVEGLGFSRDAPLRLGPPRFRDAAVQVPRRGGVLRFAMRYF
jgi:uncharacterized protein (DUF2141 family)